ncbi:MAG: peptidoglycan-associated lipoprotein Pal, partial [Candidatus Binatia bacterium]
ATQPGSPLPPQPAPPGRGETETGTRDSREPATGPSSLDQARLGERPSTPASSPLKEIYFDYDRYDVNSDSRQVLKLNADWLKANPSARVEIEGHADERGTNEYNLALGARRAQSARDYLVTLGISAERLSTISYGEELPVCKEARDDCWQRNRRARFVIITRRPAS